MSGTASSTAVSAANAWRATGLRRVAHHTPSGTASSQAAVTAVTVRRSVLRMRGHKQRADRAAVGERVSELTPAQRGQPEAYRSGSGRSRP